MRNKLYFFVVVILLAVVLSACGTAYAQATQPPTRTLNVTGSGRVFLTPDIAYISIGVQTEGKDAAEAVQDNNAQAQKVANVLKEMGVEAKDIQTTNFSIYPQQDYDDKGRVTGTTYIVDNSIYVTVRDLGQIGSLLDAVVSAGSISISGVQFDVEDKVSALSEARKAAVENARTQAEELAEAAGVTLGQVQSINVYGGYPVPVFEGKGVGGGAELAAEVPVSPGQMVLSVEVNLVYEIR